MAPQTKRNRHRQIVEGCQTNVADQPQSDRHRRNAPAHIQDIKEKSTIPATIPQTTIQEN